MANGDIPTPQQYLRLLLDEVIPQGKTDAETRFSNYYLEGLLAESPTTVGAAAIGWAVKAAMFAKFIDINESGSNRKLNQLFKNAESMRDYYTQLAALDAELIAAAQQRAVGAISAAWGDHAGKKGTIIEQVNEAQYTRMFPGHRWFPAIKR